MRISIPIHRNRRSNRAEEQINSVAHNRINTVFFMAVQNESPYTVHLFVCTNDRAGERKSCADDHGLLIKAAIKKAVDEKGWKGKVRVSASGCLGLCSTGPNVMIYPQKIWFSGVSPDDVESIVSAIERIIADEV
jgi:(2Fe-2S) ferredoxin